MATERVMLRIEGMTCDGCSQTIKHALEREAGISEVQVSWEAGLAEIDFDPERTDEGRILTNRVFRRQYRAEPWVPPRCC